MSQSARIPRGRETIAFAQGEYLEGLGIHLRAFAPAGCVGRGAVVYSNQALQDRLSLAGVTGTMLRSYLMGWTAMTSRLMITVAQACLGSDEDKFPVVQLTLIAVPLKDRT